MKFLGFKEETKALKRAIQFYRDSRWYEETTYDIWFRDHRESILKLKDIHKGKDCFIIGNGPSLNNMTLEPLNDYFTFGLNKLFLIRKRIKLMVDFFVAINPFVIEQCWEEYAQLDSMIFLSFNSTSSIKKKHLLGFNYLYEDHETIRFSRNLDRFVGAGYTVTFCAMQLAYFMGFKRVFLLGMDHTFNQMGNPNETQHLVTDDVNHFDPDYFKGQKWQLADLAGSEAAYGLAKYYFESDGRQILDSTLNGKLEVFPKISFEEALDQATKK